MDYIVLLGSVVSSLTSLTLCPGASVNNTRLALFPFEKEATQRANATTTTQLLCILDSIDQVIDNIDYIIYDQVQRIPHQPHPLTLRGVALQTQTL